MTVGGAWETWGRAEWNAALVPHLFACVQGEGQPILRIPVTPEMLARAAGANLSCAAAVRDSFVKVYRALPTWQINRLFEVPYACACWTPSESSFPPFVADLVLTLLVASASDRTYDEGNFRFRMARELCKPVGTSYRLPGLAGLWEFLEDWLSQMIDRGEHYRYLRLPDPGQRDTLIGYSKRLAFPQHRDYRKLSRVLATAGLDAQAPPRRVLHHVLEARAHFSNRFLCELHDFERCLRETSLRLHSHPFWAAVQSISWEWQDSSAGPNSRPTYSLMLEWADACTPVLHLLVRNLPMLEPIGAQALPFPLCGFTHLVPLTGSEQPQGDPLRSLVALAASQSFPGLEASPILRSAWCGAICLAPEETGEILHQPSLSSSSSVFIAVHDSLRADLLVAIKEQGDQLDVDFRVLGSKWSVVGRFPADTLLTLARNGVPPFAGMEWIARRIETPEIRLAKACRSKGSYFIRRGCAPTVTCPDSDAVMCISPSESRAFDDFPLEPGPPTEFHFPAEGLGTMPDRGELELRAYRASTLLAIRRVEITRYVTSAQFKKPTRPGAWLFEGPNGQLEKCSEAGMPFGLPNVASLDALGRVSGRIRFGLGRLSSREKREMAMSMVPLDAIPPELADLYECIAALGSVRQGVGADDLLHLLQGTVKPDGYSASWDTVRSLVENGFLDQLTMRRWRGGRFFPRRPEMYAIERANHVVLKVVGITPEVLRAALRRECAARGLHAELPILPGRLSAGPVSIRARHREQCAALAGKLGLPIRFVDQTNLCALPGFNEILSFQEGMLNAVVSDTRLSQWDWHRCRFSDLGAVPRQPVQLQRRDWGNRPNEYAIVDSSGEVIWHTRSRNWGLLVAYVLAGQTVFRGLPGGMLGRTVGGGVYLPLPTARALVLVGEGVSGLCRDDSGRSSYLYLPGPDRTARRLVASLFVSSEGDEFQEVASTARWRARTPSGPDQRSVPGRAIRERYRRYRRSLFRGDNVPLGAEGT